MPGVISHSLRMVWSLLRGRSQGRKKSHGSRTSQSDGCIDWYFIQRAIECGMYGSQSLYCHGKVSLERRVEYPSSLQGCRSTSFQSQLSVDQWTVGCMDWISSPHNRWATRTLSVASCALSQFFRHGENTTFPCHDLMVLAPTLYNPLRSTVHDWQTWPGLHTVSHSR